LANILSIPSNLWIKERPGRALECNTPYSERGRGGGMMMMTREEEEVGDGEEGRLWWWLFQ